MVLSPFSAKNPWRATANSKICYWPKPTWLNGWYLTWVLCWCGLWLDLLGLKKCAHWISSCLKHIIGYLVISSILKWSIKHISWDWCSRSSKRSCSGVPPKSASSTGMDAHCFTACNSVTFIGSAKIQFYLVTPQISTNMRKWRGTSMNMPLSLWACSLSTCPFWSKPFSFYILQCRLQQNHRDEAKCFKPPTSFVSKSIWP